MCNALKNNWLRRECDTCDSKKLKLYGKGVKSGCLWKINLYIDCIKCSCKHFSIADGRPVVLWKTSCRFMKNKPSFYEKQAVVLWKQAVVLWKTSCRFMKNKPSFYEKQAVVLWKQAVVLWKTSRCFVKNKPSFYEKQAVVLWKTSRRFMKNKPLLS